MTLEEIVEKYEGWDLHIESSGLVSMKFMNTYMAMVAMVDIRMAWPKTAIFVEMRPVLATSTTTLLTFQFKGV